MKIITSEKNRYILLSIIAVLCISFVILYMFQENHSDNVLSSAEIMELRKEYPTYNDDPEFVTLKSSTFMEIVDVAETVIIGKVISELPAYEVDLSLSGNAQSKLIDKQQSLGLPLYKPKFVQYEVLVEKVIAGVPTNEKILLAYNADFIGYEPELKAGMKIITGIAAGRDLHEGKHFFNRFGTYYVVNDKHVLSTVDDEYSTKMNGQTVDSLIAAIIAHKK